MPENVRSSHLLIVALLVAQLGITPASNARPPRHDERRPNLIILLADDLGWTDLSTHATSLGNGSRFHQTPQIDTIADAGMSFSAAYTLQNCAPTRAALMTGQYPTKNGVYNAGNGSLLRVGSAAAEKTRILPPRARRAIGADSVTLAERLQLAGYLTAHIGKSDGIGHGEELRLDHGFEIDMTVHRNALIAESGPARQTSIASHYTARKDGEGKWRFSNPAFDRYAMPYSRDYVIRNLLPVSNGNDPMRIVGSPKHLTDAIADAAVDLIRTHHSGDRPFFLNVWFHAPHRPIVARADLAEKYRTADRSDFRHKNPDYAAMVEGLDQSVGRIVAALRDPDGDGDPTDTIARQTLVIFLSDNGGTARDTNPHPLSGSKGMLLEGGIRVPMVALWPGQIRAGSRVNDAVHVVDILPTLLDVVSGGRTEVPMEGLDGESLAPILRSERKHTIRRSLYWHFPGYMDYRLTPVSMIAQRVGARRYKLYYRYLDSSYSLYDLESDIGETVNLLERSTDERTLQTAASMSQALRDWLSKERAPLGTIRRSGLPVPAPRPIADSSIPRSAAEASAD